MYKIITEGKLHSCETDDEESDDNSDEDSEEKDSGQANPEDQFPDITDEKVHVTMKEEKVEKKKKKKKKKVQTVEVIEAVNPENAEGGAIEKIRKLVDLLCERRGTVRSLWLEIGGCLKRLMKITEENVYLGIWIDFSEKFGNFSEDDCTDEWDNFDLEKAADLPTLKFWASKDNPAGYKAFKRNEIRQFLTICLNTTHVDVAQTLYLMYESRYVCSSVKNNTWYEFRGGRWREIEAGVSLRRRISKELAHEYARFRRYCLQMAEYSDTMELPDDLEYDITEEVLDELEVSPEEWLSMVECCEDLLVKLKTKGYKDQILAEAKEIFWDPDFEDKLNERHELLGFENGVIDLEKRIFREGRPDDFLTFTTKTRYNPNYKKTKEYNEIMDFLKQIYLSDEMVHYALKERAHMIHGDNTEERIFCWIGVGGNGKSKFRELNAKSLGDYAFGFPVTLFTGRRAQSGAPMPEVARAKGKRMAFVDEPEENQRLNMGLMKKLSGGDPMECRKLYGDTFEFIPQFGITLLCNDPPKVPPHDVGTQRRMMCDPHDARFVAEPKKANEFKRDQHLSRKIKKWLSCFSSMLIEYYYIYQEEGLDPPEAVTKFTQQFLKECDAYDEFISDVLIEVDAEEADESYISLQALYGSFKAWVEDNGISQRRMMSFRDFKKYLHKKIRKIGQLKQTRLYGYRERTVQEMSSMNDAVVTY
jgi:P4 family phage/plasmid primase-like protien